MNRNNQKVKSKTELLDLGSKSQLSKSGYVSISIDREAILASVNAENIGAINV